MLRMAHGSHSHGFIIHREQQREAQIRVIREITSLRSVGLRRISCSKKSRVLSAEGKIREIREIRVLKYIRVIREIRVQKKSRVLSAEGKNP